MPEQNILHNKVKKESMLAKLLLLVTRLHFGSSLGQKSNLQNLPFSLNCYNLK